MHYLSLPVGLWLIATAVLKSLDPQLFYAVIDSYRLLPRSAARRAPFVLVTLEAAMGASLLALPAPRAACMAAFLFVAALSALAMWAEATGRVEHCGCYGRALTLRPGQSALINAGLLVLLVASSVTPRVPFPLSSLYYAGIAASGTIAASLAYLSRGRSLRDWTPLKVGRAWPDLIPGWDAELRAGERVVLFLTPECRICMAWMTAVDNLHRLPERGGMPSVLGVVSVRDEDLDAFRAAHPVRFPIVGMRKEKFASAVYEWPMALVLRGGTIAERWTGRLPEHYVAQLRQLSTEKRTVS